MATKVYRFGLGSPASPYSGIWRVWTQDDEVHLAVRTALGDVTFTAYPTGRWRIAVGSAVSRWNRPKEFRPGWTRGPDILIPHRVASVPADTTDPFVSEVVAWLPPPPPGSVARFSLLLASPRAADSHWQPSDAAGRECITMLPLRTAGALHLCRVDESSGPDGMNDPLRPAANASQPAPRTPDRHPTELVVVVSADQTGLPSLRESHEG